MTTSRATQHERLLSEARASAARTIALLDAAERHEALPYLRQALALIGGDGGSEGEPDNRTAMFLLRMALVLLDRDGESEAAGDVEGALLKLGEPFPMLSEIEANAWLDRRMEQRAGRRGGASQGAV